MGTRKIVYIDEELCNGCGECVPSCAEGALQIRAGKAKLISDHYCDGLGACLGYCPQGAISIIEREADAFNETLAHELHGKSVECPSVSVQSIRVKAPTVASRESALGHWPVQLRLVPLRAPFFNQSDLLVLADCVPVAYPNLHSHLLPGRSAVLGCPKFDDAQGYVQKLSGIIKQNAVQSITIAYMEVPCCAGLDWIVQKAVEASGKTIPIKRRIISIRGEMQ